MAEPVPNNIRSLEAAILKKYEDMHATLITIHDDYSPAAFAKRDGHIDEGEISREEIAAYYQQALPYEYLTGHMAKKLAKVTGEIFDDATINDDQKAQELKTIIWGYLVGVKNTQSKVAISLEPIETALKSCSNLCEAFLKKQQAAAKSGGFDGPGS